MTRLVLALVCAVSLAACTSKHTSTADAASMVDGPPPGTFGAKCTTVTDMSTECTSGVCTNTINMIPYPVCSQRCTVLGGMDPSCPNGSKGQKCNMQGYCRP